MFVFVVGVVSGGLPCKNNPSIHITHTITHVFSPLVGISVVIYVLCLCLLFGL